MKQFDIYNVNLDTTTGAEIKKIRPAIIISPDVMNRHLNTVIIAPLTQTIRRYPSRVATMIKNKPGEAALDQLRCVDKSRLVKKVGTADQETSRNVLLVLQTMFGK